MYGRSLVHNEGSQKDPCQNARIVTIDIGDNPQDPNTLSEYCFVVDAAAIGGDGDSSLLRLLKQCVTVYISISIAAL